MYARRGGGTIEKSVPVIPGYPLGNRPYSLVVEANGFVFLSGQIGDDPVMGSVPPGGFEPEARQVFENIKTLLAGVGLELKHVVKTTVYLTDMANFQIYNALFREYFSQAPPVRATVITQLVPPYTIEIDAIAAR